MTAESTQTSPRSRRALLAGAVGGLGVWAASAIGRAAPAEAAAGDPILMGRLNRAGGASTTLRTESNQPALSVTQHGQAWGLVVSTTGAFYSAVSGTAPDGIGVAGRGGTVGVRGDGPIGVIGQSPRRSGVLGLTNEGNAIHGRTRDPDGFAGYFEGKMFTSRYVEIAGIVSPAAPKGD